MSKKRDIAIASAVATASFIANFSIFVFGYNHLTAPFISEEQRVDNAEFIMSVVVGGYAGIAILTGILTFLARAGRSIRNE